MTNEQIAEKAAIKVGLYPTPIRGEQIQYLERDKLIILSAITEATSKISDAYNQEKLIVSRIWEQLGNPTFDELKGRSIHDLIDEKDAEILRLTELLSKADSKITGYNQILVMIGRDLDTHISQDWLLEFPKDTWVEACKRAELLNPEKEGGV